MFKKIESWFPSTIKASLLALLIGWLSNLASASLEGQLSGVLQLIGGVATLMAVGGLIILLIKKVKK